MEHSDFWKWNLAKKRRDKNNFEKKNHREKKYLAKKFRLFRHGYCINMNHFKVHTFKKTAIEKLEPQLKP